VNPPSLRASCIGLALLCTSAANAADLFGAGNFAFMASDRRAERVGDSLTIIINQSATASDTTQKSATKSSNVSGFLALGSSFSRSGQGALNSGFSGAGQTGRSDTIVAQLAVVVDKVLPNGDLRIVGDQSLNINGERTKVKIRGRVRTADISNGNTVLSTNLADAVIDYDGKGFAASAAKPGIVMKIFNWLGLT
jgi:flagellar L-ring protein precursor FlgH